MNASGDFREWQPDQRFDRWFLELVPSSARKEFFRAVRPLTSEFSARLIQSLFAGIRQPFHYLRANGWMARLLRAELSLPDTASFDQRAACLRDKVAWSPSDVVLLVYNDPQACAAHWGAFLDYFQKDYINLDTMVVCHPKSRDIALFWEDKGPIFSKRGHRVLPCPKWEDGELHQAEHL